MAPTPPLPVTEDTPPDMLAGSMDLQVVLPNGKSVKMSVERSTPMMDLLVQVATVNRIPPGGHVIQAIGEKGILPYKPSTPIGALDTWTIEIVPKSKLCTAVPKKAPLKSNNQQPFEQTFRLQVHLPRNQLFVTRVSSKTSLADILTHVCTEKNLDTSKYELRHPANLEERLSLECSLADYKLQEVVVVARSSRPVSDIADIMALQKEEEKRRQQAKGGGSNRFFGNVFRRNQSNLGEGSISSDSLGGRSSSPARSDESVSRSASPPTHSLPSLVQQPIRPQRKRRPAPKPPVINENTIHTSVETHEKNLHNSVSGKGEKGATLISHSRNSSDSSGYHEASVLSESPDSQSAGHTIHSNLSRRGKLSSVHHSENQNSSETPLFSRSLSNLATVGQCDLGLQSNMKKTSHSASTSVLPVVGQRKKKAAPPPPPIAQIKKPIPEHEIPKVHNVVECDEEERLKTSSLDRHSRTTSKDDSGIDLDRSATLPAIVKRSKFEKSMGSNTSSEESVAKASMRSFSSNEGDIDEEEEEDENVIETKTKLISEVANLPPVVSEPKYNPQNLDPIEKAVPYIVQAPPDIVPVVPSQVVAADITHRLEDGSVLPSPKPRTVLNAVEPTTKPPVPLPRKLLHDPSDIKNNPPNDISHLARDENIEHLTNNSDVNNKRNNQFDTFSLVTLPRKIMDNTDELVSNGSDTTRTVEDEQLSVTSSMYDCDDSEGETEYESMKPINRNNVLKKFQNSSDTSLINLRGSLNRGNISQNKIQNSGIRGSVTSLRSLDEVPQFLTEGSNMGRWNNLEALHTVHDDARQPHKWVLGTDDSDTETELTETEDALAAFDRVISEVKPVPEQENTYISSNHKIHQPSEFPESVSKNIDSILPTKLPPPDTISPVGNNEDNEDSLSIDWQYQLPAPPSAFRDTKSPTLLEGETVVLADAEVFQENASSSLQSENCSSLESTDISEIPANSLIKSFNINKRSKDSEVEVLAPTISENEISRVNPLFRAHEYDSDLQREFSSDEEKYIHNHDTHLYKTNLTNRELNMIQSESNTNRRTSRDSLKQETSDSRRPSYQTECSTLSNFKITTYEKPNEFDNIYTELETDSKEPVVNIPVEVFKRPLPVRTRDDKYGSTHSLHNSNIVNGFDKNESKTTVKRSTSYVSLQQSSKFSNRGSNNFAFPGRAQSITDLVFEHSTPAFGTSHRRYSESNDESDREGNLEDGVHLAQLCLTEMNQKTSNEDCHSSDDKPDMQLQSLQVLRDILPQLSKTKEAVEGPSTQGLTVTEESSNVNKSVSVETNMSQINQPESKSSKTSESNKEEKRYRYQGPPAIKLSSWNERPKVMVNIKADSDYRFGGGKEEQRNVNKQPKTRKDYTQNEHSSVTKDSFKPEVKVHTKADNFNIAVKVEEKSFLTKPPSSGTLVESTTSQKSEPAVIKKQPLIISSIPKDSVASSVHIGSYASNRYVSSQIADPSRVPIVRAVELKKPLQRQSTDPSINMLNNSSVIKEEVLSNGHVIDSKTDSDGFVGVNSLAKKFSFGVQLRNSSARPYNSRPVSSYEYYDKDKLDNYSVKSQDDDFRLHNQDSKKVLSRSSSTNMMNTQNINVNNYENNVGGHKYTSVVGVNRNGLSSTSFRDQSTTNNVIKKPTGTFVKIGNFAGPRQPMPVVKGFQIPPQSLSTPSVSVKIQHTQPVTEVDSMPNRIQKTESLDMRNDDHSVNIMTSRSAGTVSHVSPAIVKVQHQPLNNKQSLMNQKPNSLEKETIVPPPPPAPAFSNIALKKSTNTRPKSMPVISTDPRDQLMEAIRAHGGLGSLKKIRRLVQSDTLE